MADIRKAIPGPMRGARSTGGGGRGMTALFRSFVRCVRASVAVELALLTPVLLFMLIGLIDFGGAIHERMQLTSAARAGVQFAIQSSGNVDDTAGILLAVSRAGELVDANITITTFQFCGCPDGSAASCGGTCGGGGQAGTYVSVTVVEQFKTLLTYPGISNPIALEGEAVFRVR